jgi:hypothetical protein
MVHRFLNVVSIVKFILLFYQRYIANIIGAACSSRILQANLNAWFNFVHAKNLRR